MQVRARERNQPQRLTGGALQLMWVIEPIRALCDSLGINTSFMALLYFFTSQRNDSLAENMC